MEKGTRVEIVRGQTGTGAVGTVFWVGEDRYNEGTKRLGVRGDDGETYWVSGDDVEKSNAAVPVHEAPDLNRGDRVTWTKGGVAGEGEVFWVGPSKHGPGVRVGVKDGEESLWFDAHQLKLATGNGASAPTNGASAPQAPPSRPAPEPPMDDDIPF